MVKKLFPGLIILTILICSCTSKSMDKGDVAKNDSIKKYLDLAGDVNLDNEKRKHYNDMAYSLVDLSKNDTLTRFYLSSLCFNYIKTGQIKKYKNVAKFHFDKSTVSKDTLNIVRYYWYKASVFMYAGINDSAMYYYIKAEKRHKNIKNKVSLASIKLNKGIIQSTNGDYIGAELSLLQAYSLYNSINDKYHVYGTLNQLGLVYNELMDFNNSLRYHKMALETVKKYNLTEKGLKEAICFNNIGYLYLNHKKYSKAIENFELGLKYKNVINDDKELYALLKTNLAYSKLEIKKNNEVLTNLLDALKIKNELTGLPVLTNVYIYLSKYYLAEGDILLAKGYANEALKISVSSKNKLDYLTALRNITGIDKEYLAKYYIKYTAVNDSLQIAERKSKNNFARIQLETDEIIQEKETALKQKWIIGILSGFIILIVILLLIITRQRNKQKEFRMLQEQQKSNEQIYHLMLTQKEKEDEARQAEKKRIARELHDGIMNKLSATKLNLSALSRIADKDTSRKCLVCVNDISEIETDIRVISHDLSQEVFQKGDSFIKMLEDFVITQNETSHTHFELEIDPVIDWNSISSEIRMHLYRILQEASHNINKYAQAETATINFVQDELNICMSITDNGIGFDTAMVSKGIGIKNMETRVKFLFGKFALNSTKGNTSINIAIPFV